MRFGRKTKKHYTNAYLTETKYAWFPRKTFSYHDHYDLTNYNDDEGINVDCSYPGPTPSYYGNTSNSNAAANTSPNVVPVANYLNLPVTDFGFRIWFEKVTIIKERQSKRLKTKNSYINPESRFYYQIVAVIPHDDFVAAQLKM